MNSRQNGGKLQEAMVFLHESEYCDERVCLSVCLPVRVREHISGTTFPNIHQIVVGVMAVARSFSGGVEIRPVLPVLWMTS